MISTDGDPLWSSGAGEDLVDEVEPGLEAGDGELPGCFADMVTAFLADAEEADAGRDTDGDGVRRKLLGDELSRYCKRFGDVFSNTRVRIRDTSDEFDSGLDSDWEEPICRPGMVSVNSI